MKYVQQQTLKSPGPVIDIDWSEELTKHINGAEDRIESDRLTILSMNWITCACGNQCAIIPRDRVGKPNDVYLATLGSEFAMRIKHQEYKLALQILGFIEERSRGIINDIRSRKLKEIMSYGEKEVREPALQG